MFDMGKKCLCKGMILGLGIGMTVGFTVCLITSKDKKSDIVKKSEKIVKAVQTVLSGF